MSQDAYHTALTNARSALKAGDKAAARDWALAASKLSPDNEDPWLILAAVASPRASLEYLNRALAINPESQRARQGMHWAIQRYRASEAGEETPSITTAPIAAPFPKEALVRQRNAVWPWFMLVGIFLMCLIAGFGYPRLSGALRPGQLQAAAQVIEKAVNTPEMVVLDLPADTPLDTPILHPTDLPTATPTATATAQPTFTPAPTATETLPPTITSEPPTDTPEPIPTDTLEPVPTETEAPPEPEPQLQPNGQGEPPAVDPGERWIDVDLSQQRVYAYEGDQIVNTFLVSTGAYGTPTVTGQYRIYVKYRLANMSGPGYNLPDVPFVMYFYKGYGLHGTYWHSNFGTPMSHGCVNLKTKEARWLFEWASVGTIVYVHR